VALAALPAGAGADDPLLPSVTLTTPALPPVTVSVPTPTPITLTTPAVPAITVSTPAVPTPSAQVPPATTPVTTPSTPVTASPASGNTGSPTGTTPSSGSTTSSQGGSSTRARRRTPSHHSSGGNTSTGGRHRPHASGQAVRTVNTAAHTVTPGESRPAADKAKKGDSLGDLGTTLAHSLPRAIELALIALVAIASLMSIDAYVQGRRARRLTRQRQGLLDDVGLLQAALLPNVPRRAGELAVSVGYRPAQGLAAGGDFYDVFPLDRDRTGIILGDVSGHGRESLIQAALVRYTLRTLMGEGHSLGEVLARADRYLEAEMGSNFATVIVATYDNANSELRYAKAGHEPPLISGVETASEETATPLGLGLGHDWPEFSHYLLPDETVCFYTDGLKEARKRGEQLGRDHIEALVREGLDAQELIARVEKDADTANDDLAAVILRNASGKPAGRFERPLSSASSSSPRA
jgi:Stage II sporulation protein E (SpoIIE)